ncbi:hypothetical protein JTB14_033839 [Gonioctena quinquepunctata]|nr:hypothetical protein JTB14_033839 [Gonioctena quinquepunctata]
MSKFFKKQKPEILKKRERKSTAKAIAMKEMSIKNKTIPGKKNQKSTGKSKKPYYERYHEGKDGVPVKTLRCVKCSGFVRADQKKCTRCISRAEFIKKKRELQISEKKKVDNKATKTKSKVADEINGVVVKQKGNNNDLKTNAKKKIKQKTSEGRKVYNTQNKSLVASTGKNVDGSLISVPTKNESKLSKAPTFPIKKIKPILKKSKNGNRPKRIIKLQKNKKNFKVSDSPGDRSEASRKVIIPKNQIQRTQKFSERSFCVLESSEDHKPQPKKRRASENSVRKVKSKTGPSTKSTSDVDQNTEPPNNSMNPNNEHNYSLREGQESKHFSKFVEMNLKKTQKQKTGTIRGFDKINPMAIGDQKYSQSQESFLNYLNLEQNIHISETCEELQEPVKYFPTQISFQSESNADSQDNLGEISIERVIMEDDYVIFDSPNIEIIEENDWYSENE